MRTYVATYPIDVYYSAALEYLPKLLIARTSGSVHKPPTKKWKCCIAKRRMRMEHRKTMREREMNK
jgi:hypothetical protein